MPGPNFSDFLFAHRQDQATPSMSNEAQLAALADELTHPATGPAALFHMLTSGVRSVSQAPQVPGSDADEMRRLEEYQRQMAEMQQGVDAQLGNQVGPQMGTDQYGRPQPVWRPGMGRGAASPDKGF